MIYFKKIEWVRGFIQKELVDKNKSINVEEWKVLEQPTKIYLKHSSKEFHSNAEVIEELKRMELLHEIIEFQGASFTNPQSHGYILEFSRIKRILKGESESLEGDILTHKLLTINQSCEFLGFSRPTLYKLIEKKEINSFEILGKKRIQLFELIKYISQKKKQL
jgi:excisionase family DNA binding protein